MKRSRTPPIEPLPCPFCGSEATYCPGLDINNPPDIYCGNQECAFQPHIHYKHKHGIIFRNMDERWQRSEADQGEVAR